jgi:beclin 1
MLAKCRYKIIPLGSFSRIEELPRNSYDLYYSTEFTQVLQTRKFNHGLVALLDCLRQLVEHGSGRDWGKGNIEYVSISFTLMM